VLDYTSELNLTEVQCVLQCVAEGPSYDVAAWCCVMLCFVALQCDAVCCSVYRECCSVQSVLQCAQCVAVYCSVLQCDAVRNSVLQSVAECCSVLQMVAECSRVWCSVLQYIAVCCSVLQCAAVCCSVLQIVASVLQCIVSHQRCSWWC